MKETHRSSFSFFQNSPQLTRSQKAHHHEGRFAPTAARRTNSISAQKTTTSYSIHQYGLAEASFAASLPETTKHRYSVITSSIQKYYVDPCLFPTASKLHANHSARKKQHQRPRDIIYKPPINFYRLLCQDGEAILHHSNCVLIEIIYFSGHAIFYYLINNVQKLTK